MSKHAIRFLNSSRQAEQLAKACELSVVSLERQMRTAYRLLECIFFTPGWRGKGMLLADEVGLGKTTVGALVALLAASEGKGRTVRILVPNPTIRQRWEQELQRVAQGLQQVLPHLGTDPSQIRAAPVRFRQRHIHVTTHFRALQRNQVSGDLIIVDEAHRSRDADGEFRKNIARAALTTSRLLFLTATPMSTKPAEMAALLEVLGGTEAGDVTCALGEQIVRLYDPNDQRSEQDCCVELEQAARKALDILPDYIVRHTVNGLQPREYKVFGHGRTEWHIEVPDATPEELELLARADRILRLAHPRGTRFNDPQYHVSRSVLRQALDEARPLLQKNGLETAAAPHYVAIKRGGLLDTVHPKMHAVAQAIEEKVAAGEKVVVFCHHHFVGAELARVLHDALPVPPATAIDAGNWREALQQLIQHRMSTADTKLSASQIRNVELMREHFIDWLCSPSFRDQIASWLPTQPDTLKNLLSALRRTKAPRSHRRCSIAEALQDLFDEITAPSARSTREIFRRLNRKMERGQVMLDSLPFGSTGLTSRVLGACNTRNKDEQQTWQHVFSTESRPELLMALFNSPFGPDVLVLTDRYSEGIDLHKSCRLLVHYELDPSVMRTIQRDGRVRRVGGLAGATRRTVEYAMPAFGATRDERLVEIMHDRINNFSLLLGAVRDLADDDLGNEIDERAKRILAKSKRTLEALSKAMTCDMR